MGIKSSLQLKKGEEKIRSFTSLATGGYVWQFKIEHSDIVSVEKTGNKNSSNIPPGASADEVFIIKGLKSGSTTITFTQSRNWEKDVAPAQTKTYQVNVTQ